MSATHQCCGFIFWIYILVIVAIVLFAGLMSGLTLGLMSLGLVDLEVLVKSGQPKDKKHAAKILPVVQNQHLLLCTLLICNSLAMEALPIFLDSLVTAWGAVLISVTLILLFGEILPQSICSRHGLAVGATMAPVVRVLVWIFFPITYPISKLLDAVLGKNHVALFRRAELKTLVTMHANEAGKGGELTHDETTIIAGALELTEKTAADAMTPISSVFSIDINAKLDKATIDTILSKGHSRIPVYLGRENNTIGLILVKNLLSIRPEEGLSVRDITIRKIPRVGENMPLYDILNEFQKGHSHMAVVVRYSKEKEQIMNQNRQRSQLTRKLSSLRPQQRLSGSKFLPGHESVDLASQENSMQVPVATLHGMSSNLQTQNGSYVDGFRKENAGLDHMISGQRTRKWGRTHSGDILKIHSDMCPTFPDDEEVVGIITMEDVIEELLQEEIYDETDIYIDLNKLSTVAGSSTPQMVSPITTTSEAHAIFTGLGRSLSQTTDLQDNLQGSSHNLAMPSSTSSRNSPTHRHLHQLGYPVSSKRAQKEEV